LLEEDLTEQLHNNIINIKKIISERKKHEMMVIVAEVSTSSTKLGAYDLRKESALPRTEHSWKSHAVYFYVDGK
jgi:hypothetical protein